MKDVYADVIDKIFDEQSENEILNGVVEKTLDLYTRQIELRHVKQDENYLQNLIITKKCRRLWRRYSYHLNLFQERMKRGR